MVVRVEGLDHAGRSVRRAWHIAADHDDGPGIPCMATIVLSRKLAAGGVMVPDAFTAAGLLSLDEFEAGFAGWGVVTDVVNESPEAVQGTTAGSAPAA